MQNRPSAIVLINGDLGYWGIFSSREQLNGFYISQITACDTEALWDRAIQCHADYVDLCAHMDPILRFYVNEMRLSKYLIMTMVLLVTLNTLQQVYMFVGISILSLQ